MSPFHDLDQIYKDLDSSTITNRKTGVENLIALCQDPQFVALIKSKGKGARQKQWQFLYNATCQVVRVEKADKKKKDKAKTSGSSTGAAAAAARLERAATALRILVENSAPQVWFMGDSLVSEILDLSVDNGVLNTTMALQCIKALHRFIQEDEVILRLNVDTWKRIVAFAFNVILGDPISASLEDEVKKEEPEDASLDAFYLPDEDSEEEDQRASKRRKITPSRVSPHKGKGKLKSKVKAKSELKSSTSSPQPEGKIYTPSTEQRDLMALLSTLFRGDSSSLLRDPQKHGDLTSSVLSRMVRFLDTYVLDSSLQADYLSSLYSILTALSLNRQREVERFACETWTKLAALWDSKEKRSKADLVNIFRMLYPFGAAACSDDRSKMWNTGVSDLWIRLDEEISARWALESLQLESLRLQVQSPDEVPSPATAFVAKTFRLASNVTSDQALAWAYLELQADCTKQMYLMSESFNPSATPVVTQRTGGKRSKMSSPIKSLLISITNLTASSQSKTFRLQVLLFLVERHWACVHADLQATIVATLTSLLSATDNDVQCWAFLCCAAVARASCSPENPQASLTASTWDDIWSRSVRRINVPAISRAACHAAHALLLCGSSPGRSSTSLPLDPAKILSDIENLGTDLEIQGPASVCDSACLFLAECLRRATQDVKLFRIQMNRKALNWLKTSWRVSQFDDSLGVNDMLHLLGTICSFEKPCSLIEPIILPRCHTVDTLFQYHRDSVVRDFVLNARLPSYSSSGSPDQALKAQNAGPPPTASQSQDVEMDLRMSDFDLLPPRETEEAVSQFFQKSLEDLLMEWESDTTHRPSIHYGWQSLRFTAVALAFTGLMFLNGIRSNRRVLHCSAKLASAVFSPINEPNLWSSSEKLSLLQSLESLLLTGSEDGDNAYEALVPPGPGTGIRRKVSRTLSHVRHVTEELTRMSLQRFIWSNNYMQDSCEGILDSIAELLADCCNPGVSQASDGRDRDFDSIRIAGALVQADQGQFNTSIDLARQCITYLTVVPSYQSTSGESSRAQSLAEQLLKEKSHKDHFLQLVPIMFDQVRRGVMKITQEDLTRYANLFENRAINPHWNSSEPYLLATVDFIQCTMDTWLPAVSSVPKPDYIDSVWLLISSLQWKMKQNELRSWQARDKLTRLLHSYLALYPQQIHFLDGVMDDPDKQDNKTRKSKMEDAMDVDEDGEDREERQQDEKEVEFPHSMLLLMTMMKDDDIRVRFRAAAANTQLFTVARVHSINNWRMNEIYGRWTSFLPARVDQHEHTLTRLLSLGNIIITNAVVRRGPYWHFLETFFQASHSRTPVDPKYMQTILVGVAQRLGLASASALFDAYASQISYTLRQHEHSLFQLPPRILGYSDVHSMARSTFHLFSPTNIAAPGSAESRQFGRSAFETHCKYIKLDTSVGFQETFGDAVGLYIANAFYSGSSSSLDAISEEFTAYLDRVHFQHTFETQFPSVMTAILRALGDTDWTANGPILNTLVTHFVTTLPSEVFRALVSLRQEAEYEPYEPTYPAFPVADIIAAIHWVKDRAPSHDIRVTTYHILRQVFQDIHRSMVVNEQIRLLNTLCLWISMHSDEMRDPTLLHTLMHGAASLLPEEDLLHASQSLLDWAISVYGQTACRPDSRFPDLLIRICCTMLDYSDESSTEKDFSTHSLLSWIDILALKLVENQDLREQIIETLTAWPYEPSLQLQALRADPRTADISRVLKDPSISSNKFRLVRRLYQNALQAGYETTQFQTTDFWRLKKSIPPRDQLQDDDVQAFASLLLFHNGHVGTFTDEAGDAALDRSANRTKDASGDQGATTHITVIRTLLRIVEGPDNDRTALAYMTLRRALAAYHVDHTDTKAWSFEQRDVIRYLQAFPARTRESSGKSLTELLRDASLLQASNFAVWIGSICSALSHELSGGNALYAQLHDIFFADQNFAQCMFPLLTHAFLQSTGQDLEMSSARKDFSKYVSDVLEEPSSPIPCLQAIIDVVLHLRNFTPPVSSLTEDKWLDVDFLVLANKAILCGSYTTAILFLELAVEYAGTPGDVNTDSVLYDIYKHIDEPDGFYGIQAANLQDFLVKRFHHEQQWDKAFRFHGAQMEAGSASLATPGLLKTFSSFGLDHLAMKTLSTASDSDKGVDVSSIEYRLGWRTDRWDLPLPSKFSPDASLYSALRAVHRERDPEAIRTVVRSALAWDMEHLRALGPENLAEIREITRNLMALSEISKWAELSAYRRDVIPMDFSSISTELDFPDLDLVMTTRMAIIRSVRLKEKQQTIGPVDSPSLESLIELERACLIRLSEAARDANRGQIALNSVIRAQELSSLISPTVSGEFANVLWHEKEQKLAVQALKSFLSQLYIEGASLDDSESTQKAVGYARLGNWLSEACLDKPLEVQEKCFQPAFNLISPLSDPQYSKVHGSIYHQYAVFADSQFQAAGNSVDMLRRKIYIERKKEEINILTTKMHSATSEHVRRALTAQRTQAGKQLEEDKNIFNFSTNVLKSFLEQALEMYSRCLEVCDDYDDSAPLSLCSLWFTIFGDSRLQEVIDSCLQRVQSRKMVFLVHQITARLSATTDENASHKSQMVLQKLLLRMGKEHPFHTLYPIFCIQSKRPKESGRRHSGRQQSSPHIKSERVDAAFELLQKLKTDVDVAERVNDVLRLSEAHLQWAEYPIKDYVLKFKDRQPIPVPPQLDIVKLRNVKVPVVTAPTPLDPSMRYDDIDHFVKYEKHFATAGGVNLPKVHTCIGSIRPKHKQLFKGEGADDLRQDAVMEQVFDLCNTVLRRDRETRRRNLSVRGYKVIPLAATAGLLEFVDNTTVLNGWLDSAHRRYHPKEPTHREIFSMLINFRKAQAHKSLREKEQECIRRFKEIKRNFHPVMRHYFHEKTKVPMNWFKMRLNYTRSVATTSIVGHVLGLGDRHSSNILIDNVTGEVVHIDLGIAFEQGKLLNVPEVVPFRLTADMVDGMGISGTQGVFQRCAEETLRVLRDGSTVIMTVLEVFKHDPLHSWTASEEKIRKIQGTSSLSKASTVKKEKESFNDPVGFVQADQIGISVTSDSVEESADRALSAVKRKLDKALTVEYTVNDLIMEATSDENLGRMYGGWGPHL